jgi:hypothetical protein
MADESTIKGKKLTRQKIVNRWGMLKQERSSWWSQWQELSSYILPISGRFFVQDRNKGNRRGNNIYDSTGTRALRILGAGMMAGATSPARPWFRLATADPDLNQYHPVRVWLDDVTRLMQTVFQKSNTYRSLHGIYEELGCFGTAAAIILLDYKNIIHHYVLTAGEYAIATDYQGKVCTIYREFERPVSEVVKEFGYDQCSTAVKNMFDRGQLDQWVGIIHAIEPRADRDISKIDNRNMKWASYYMEASGNENKFLRESGFNHFPSVVPRWAISGGDIYGNSPAMESLGDIKQLQHEQLRKAQCIDYKTKPPLQIPNSLKNRDVDMLPGGATYYDVTNTNNTIKSLFEVNLDLQHLLMDIQDVRERIRGSFFADLFLMLANSENTRMTATEVAERHEEKLLMLGPVLERLHNELLDPLIEITFSHMMQAGILPPPPEQIEQGMEINVEFVSMLAQAQRAVGANSVDRWMGNLGAVAQFKPDVLDKFDSDYWSEAYADMLGVDPKMIVATDKVALIRKGREEAQAKAQQAAEAEQQSKTIKNLGGASMGQDSVLTNVMDQFTGYNTPGVVR